MEYLGPTLDPVSSAQGTRVVPDRLYDDFCETDLLLVPGGHGTRALVNDSAFIDWLKQAGLQSKIVTSICTGSALLAQAGLLENHRATSNKRAFTWVSTLGKNVIWEPSARWVHDGTRWTSSGVAAGIDMAAAIIAKLVGESERDEACRRAEIVITKNPANNTFAARPLGFQKGSKNSP